MDILRESIPPDWQRSSAGTSRTLTAWAAAGRMLKALGVRERLDQLYFATHDGDMMLQPMTDSVHDDFQSILRVSEPAVRLLCAEQLPNDGPAQAHQTSAFGSSGMEDVMDVSDIGTLRFMQAHLAIREHAFSYALENVSEILNASDCCLHTSSRDAYITGGLLRNLVFELIEELLAQGDIGGSELRSLLGVVQEEPTPGDFVRAYLSDTAIRAAHRLDSATRAGSAREALTVLFEGWDIPGEALPTEALDLWQCDRSPLQADETALGMHALLSRVSEILSGTASEVREQLGSQSDESNSRSLREWLFGTSQGESGRNGSQGAESANTLGIHFLRQLLLALKERITRKGIFLYRNLLYHRGLAASAALKLYVAERGGSPTAVDAVIDHCKLSAWPTDPFTGEHLQYIPPDKITSTGTRPELGYWVPETGAHVRLTWRVPTK